MFTFPFTALTSFLNLFKTPTIHDNLEAYIVSNNPQTADDVDRLEREFWDKKNSQNNWLYQ